VLTAETKVASRVEMKAVCSVETKVVKLVAVKAAS